MNKKIAFLWAEWAVMVHDRESSDLFSTVPNALKMLRMFALDKCTSTQTIIAYVDSVSM